MLLQVQLLFFIVDIIVIVIIVAIVVTVIIVINNGTSVASALNISKKNPVSFTKVTVIMPKF